MKKLSLLALSFLLPFSAYAVSPISNVGSAGVTEGLLNVEARAGYTFDDEDAGSDQRLRTRQHIDYGFNDWYAGRIIFQQDKLSADNFEHVSVEYQNRIQLIEKSEYGWEGGFRLNYVQRDGDKSPNEVTMRFIANVPFAEVWEFRSDTVLGREVGADQEPGVAMELRHQVTRKIESPTPFITKLKLGAEMFNDFDKLNQQSGYSEQDHQFGPLIKANFAGGSYLQTGYRTGLSKSATDHSFRLFLGHNF